MVKDNVLYEKKNEPLKNLNVSKQKVLTGKWKVWQADQFCNLLAFLTNQRYSFVCIRYVDKISICRTQMVKSENNFVLWI